MVHRKCRINNPKNLEEYFRGSWELEKIKGKLKRVCNYCGYVDGEPEEKDVINEK